MATNKQTSELDPEKLIDDDIDRLNMREALGWAKFFKIKPKKDVDLKGIKSMIKLELMRHRKGSVRSTDEASAIIVDMKGKDEVKRERLAKMLDEIESRMLKLQNERHDPLHDQLETSIPGFMRELARQKGRLRTRNCPILFAGETSAGKSSLLNLILGDDILPCSHLSNTSVICEISYSEKRFARIYYWDTGKEPVVVEDGENFKETLASYIHTKDDRQKRWPYKKAEIFLPIGMLKDGLYIVDSPGVGENKEITRLVLDYLVEAFAFIYVINSSNAGGVQTDRLQNLLREVASRKSPDEQSMFSPSAAIFVCNKWDQVPVNEKEAVKIDTLKKLKKCWPGCEESQMFCMNTDEALRLARHGFVSSDFSRLLDGIMRLVPVSLENKINYSFSWTSYLISRVIHHLDAFLNQAEKSKEERKQTFYQIHLRLQKLEKDTDAFFKKLTKTVDEKVDKATSHLRQYFKQPDVIEKAQVWYQADVPMSTNWPHLNLAITDAMAKRIQDALNAWETREGFFNSQRPRLIEDFQKQFIGIENQLNLVENMIARHDILALSDKPFQEEEETNISENDPFIPYDFNLKLGHKIALGVASPILVPVAVLAAVVVFPVYGGLVAKDRILSVRDESRFETYAKNPIEYLVKRTEKDFKVYAESKELKKYVKDQLQPAYSCIQQLKDVVPRQIEADMAQVQSLRDDQREANEYVKFYEPMKKLFEFYKNILTHFRVTCLLRDKIDIDWTYIEWPENVSSICKGVYSTLFQAFCLKQVDTTKQVDKKTRQMVSLRRLDIHVTKESVLDYLKEEEAYRFKAHKSIAKFYHVTKDIDNVYHVLEPIKYSLRVHVQQSRDNKTMTADNVRFRFLHSLIAKVVEGLEYLHQRHFVHFDLSLDTVGVDFENNVKLTNISNRRMVDLDRENKSLEYFLLYCHLAPEVICSPQAAYTPYADMYAVGLMMWEAWCGGRKYKHELEKHFRSQSPNENAGTATLPSSPVNTNGRGLSPTCSDKPITRDRRQSTPIGELKYYVSSLFSSQKTAPTPSRTCGESPEVDEEDSSDEASDSEHNESKKNDLASQCSPENFNGRRTIFDRFADYMKNSRPDTSMFYDQRDHCSSPSADKWLSVLKLCWEDAPNSRPEAKNWLAIMPKIDK